MNNEQSPSLRQQVEGYKRLYRSKPDGLAALRYDLEANRHCLERARTRLEKRTNPSVAGEVAALVKRMIAAREIALRELIRRQ